MIYLGLRRAASIAVGPQSLPDPYQLVLSRRCVAGLGYCHTQNSVV